MICKKIFPTLLNALYHVYIGRARIVNFLYYFYFTFESYIHILIIIYIKLQLLSLYNNFTTWVAYVLSWVSNIIIRFVHNITLPCHRIFFILFFLQLPYLFSFIHFATPEFFSVFFLFDEKVINIESYKLYLFITVRKLKPIIYLFIVISAGAS